MKYNTFTFYRQTDRRKQGDAALKALARERMLEELERRGAKPVGEFVFRWEWALKASVETDKEQ